MRKDLWGTAGVALLASVMPVQAKEIGNWTITLGKECHISQSWDNKDGGKGVVAIGYVDGGRNILLAMADTLWKLKKGENFKVGLAVDSLWSSTLPGVAADRTTAAVLLPASSKAVNALMNGKELDMDIKGKGDDYAYTYYLDDTQEALGALDSCRFDTDALSSSSSPDDQGGGGGSSSDSQPKTKATKTHSSDQ